MKYSVLLAYVTGPTLTLRIILRHFSFGALILLFRCQEGRRACKTSCRINPQTFFFERRTVDLA